MRLLLRTHMREDVWDADEIACGARIGNDQIFFENGEAVAHHFSFSQVVRDCEPERYKNKRSVTTHRAVKSHRLRQDDTHLFSNDVAVVGIHVKGLSDGATT